MRIVLAHNAVLFVVCLLAALAFTAWIYSRTTPTLSTGKRLLLGSLRLLALTLMLFLLFKPSVSRTMVQTEPPEVAVLVDNSESMRNALGIADSVRISDLVNQIGLPDPQEVSYFSFDSDLRGPLTDSSVLNLNGQRTNLSNALHRLTDEMAGKNYAGAVIVSDGQVNSGTNPLFTADDSAVPILTVVVGDTTQQKDIFVSLVETNDLSFIDTILPFEVRLQHYGFEGQIVAVELSESGRVLDRENVTLPVSGGELSIQLETRPSTAGIHSYEIEVTHVAGEETFRNNSEAVRVRILDKKRNVLVVAGAPGPDVAATLSLLDSDPNVRVTSRIQKSPSEFYEGDFVFDRDSVDVAILIGFPARDTDPLAVELIASAIEAGTPALYMLSSASAIGQIERVLGSAAPVKPVAVRSQLLEAILTRQGTDNHTVLDETFLSDALLRAWGPAYISESRWTTAPDATPLLSASARGIDLGVPALTLLRRNRQRSAALLAAGSWRWKNLPASRGEGVGTWPILFSNLIGWLASVEDDRPVRVEPIHESFSSDDPIEFVGQVYDESLNPVTDAEVTVTIESSDGAQFPFVMDGGTSGRYRLLVGSLPEGTYSYTAKAVKDETAIGSDTGEFDVGKLALEAKTTRSNPLAMRQIAARSGGQSFGTGAVSDWAEIFGGLNTYRPKEISTRSDLKLWRLSTFLFLIVACLTAEWFIRKRSGMV